MRPVQYFTDEYLEHCKKLSYEEIIEFLEQCRLLHEQTSENKSRSKLISMKVPEDLLSAFKTKCLLMGVPYQSQIKSIMRSWLRGG